MWDMEHENYKNETMRSQGYEYIASATGLPLDDVKVRSYARIRDIGVCKVCVAGKWQCYNTRSEY